MPLVTASGTGGMEM
jgi:hypothetical protein